MTESEFREIVSRHGRASSEAKTAYSVGYRESSRDAIAKFEWARQASWLGVEDAIQEVIKAYQDGAGTDPDPRQAFEWLKKAADLKIEAAYFDLAIAYKEGVGTSVDADKFWEWMAKAATELQDGEAMFQLAKAHEEGFSATASAKQAFYWANEMAKANAPVGMIRVARAFKEGAIIARDPAKFLEWAKKASEFALLDFEKAKPDWANEDLPRALSTLAEAYESNNKISEAKGADRRAAKAAVAAIRRSLDARRKVSEDLPEIIFKRLAGFKDKNGRVSHSRKKTYLKVLIEAADAIELTFPNQGSSCPPALVSVLYELALEYKRGGVVTRNRSKYLRWLELAAAKRNPEAMYELALLRKKQKKDNEYASGIKNAAEIGHAKAFVTDSLDNCQLSKIRYKRILPLLLRLSDVVVRIRKDEHAVIDEDAPFGVAHYTDRKAMESMLSSSPKDKTNVLRLYNIAYFNDPDEGKRLIDFTESQLGQPNPLGNFIISKDSNKANPWIDQSFHVYVCSFALVADRLDLWRAYGKDGQGYCIVTNLSVFRGDAGKPLMGGSWGDEAGLSTEIPLNKVLYGDDKVKSALKMLAPVLNAIDRAIPKKHPARAPINEIVITTVSELLYLYKSLEYASEREARVVMALKLSAQRLKRDKRESSVRLYTETVPMLFKSLGSKIIIGPKVQDVASAIVDLEHNLACQGWSDNCPVEHSTIHYK
jgi:TPR repeat protein